MRVFVTGASGLVGGRLCRLLEADHEVVALSRRPRNESADGIRWVTGDVQSSDRWADEVDGCQAVIHLAGEPIAAGRWTAARKRRIVASRVEGTRRIVEAIRASHQRPETLICASACGFYGPRGEELLDEDSSGGDDFLARLCRDWEAAARVAQELGLRVALLRFGVVLAARGGALARMLPPFRLGLGGPIGPPSRWFPWISLDDAVALSRFALESDVSGPLNAVAPGAVRMGEFAAELARCLGRRARVPVPLGLLRPVLGELADALTAGQRIAPRRVLEAGFEFRHGDLEVALRACLREAGVRLS